MKSKGSKERLFEIEYLVLSLFHRVCFLRNSFKEFFMQFYFKIDESSYFPLLVSTVCFYLSKI